MLTSRRKSFAGAHTALVVVVALVAAVVCLVAVASAGARPAGAQEEQGSPPRATAAEGKEKTPVRGDGNPIIYKRVDSRPGVEGGLHRHVIECPVGYKATGGGWDLNNPGNGSPDENSWDIRASYPYHLGRTWIVEAYGHTSLLNKKLPTFTAYAACAPQHLLGGLEYTWPQRGLIFEKPKTISTTCGRDERVIGGGFSFGASEKLVRSERSREDDRSWVSGAKLVSGINLGSIDNWAVCVSRDALEDTQYLEATDTSSRRATANTPSCPQGTYLLSGGAGVPDDANALWSNSSPPHEGAQSWKASAIPKGSIFIKAITVHAFALCGRFADQPGAGGGKPSGNNPGWGDGMGGGRFK